MKRWRRRYTFVPVFIIAAVLTACAGGEVHDTTRPIELEPIVAIGAPGQGPQAQFGRVSAIAADSAGRIFVADDMASEIRAYDADMNLLWVSGRKGEGPGEFQGIKGLTTALGRVYVRDAALARISVLDTTTGELVGEVGYRIPGGAIYTNGQLSIDAMSRASFGTMRVYNRPDPEFPDLLDYRESLVTLDLSSGEVSVREIPHRRLEEYLFDRPNGEIGSLNLPFAPWQVWTPNPHGGYTTGWGGEYRIVELGPEGDTVRVIGREVGPRKRSPRAMDLARQDVVLNLRAYMTPAAAARVPLPPRQQQFVSFTYSRDGRTLWVRRTQFDPEPTYDAFVDGEYRCTVRLANDDANAEVFFVPLAAVAGRIYQLVQDARTDIPYVLAYDVPAECG